MNRIIFIITLYLCCSVLKVSAISSTDSTLSSNQLCTGVDIHFVTGHEKDLDMIAAAGFKFIRMDLLWQTTELRKGKFNWQSYDELAANLKKRGIHAIFILCYSNSLYEKTVDTKDPLTGVNQRDIASPQHIESIAAFANWAAAAALHFKSNDIIWEIWNEPNISFWRPGPDASQYITLTKATCKAIKDAVPEAAIIGPATSLIPLPFLETIMTSGLLEQLDAISVHPYRDYSLPPETVATDYLAVRKLIEKYAPVEKKHIPIINSEWGYASATKGVTPERQAVLSVRMHLANLLNGIPISIWYDWKNDGDNPGDFEHNCGTVTSDLKPKPAYIAAQVINTQLKGFTFLNRIDTNNENDFILLFRNKNDSYKICAWTINQSHSVVMDNLRNVKVATAVDGMGNIINPITEQNKLVLQLNEMPQYITFPEGM